MVTITRPGEYTNLRVWFYRGTSLRGHREAG